MCVVEVNTFYKNYFTWPPSLVINYFPFPSSNPPKINFVHDLRWRQNWVHKSSGPESILFYGYCPCNSPYLPFQLLNKYWNYYCIHFAGDYVGGGTRYVLRAEEFRRCWARKMSRTNWLWLDYCCRCHIRHMVGVQLSSLLRGGEGTSPSASVGSSARLFNHDRNLLAADMIYMNKHVLMYTLAVRI